MVNWLQPQINPWPLTVGGSPLYYATPNHPYPPTCGKGGRNAPMMKEPTHRLKTWERPSDELVEEIAASLVEKGVGLRLFGWCGVRWYAQVHSTQDGMNLPSTICGLLVMWEVSSKVRNITPMSDLVERIIDNTCYKPTLRPGVLLESKGGSGTTSGIPLLGHDGKRWFTVAEHGFPRGNEEVHHPSYIRSGDKLIGLVDNDKKFPGSDIGLAHLQDAMTYSVVSFDGDETHGTKLEGLIQSQDTSVGESLFFDSPYNGLCEGILGLRGVSVVPMDPGHPEFVYLHTNMVYFGNGATDVLPESCGSAMWNDKNKVAAVFHWYDAELGVAYAPSVNVLIEAGYTLEAIP